MLNLVWGRSRERNASGIVGKPRPFYRGRCTPIVACASPFGGKHALTKGFRAWLSFSPWFRFVRAYNPIAVTKATAAAIVLRETLRHLVETSA